MSNKVYTTKVLEVLDNGDAVVELPDDLCEQLGWVVGDRLDFECKNNAIYIKNLDADVRKKQSENES